MKAHWLSGMLLGCLLVACPFAVGQDAEDTEEATPGPEDEILAVVDAYVTAYNAGDAEALAALWSPSGVYTNPTTGEQTEGRDEIAKVLAETFAGDNDPKLAVFSETVNMISPSVALETGTATVTRDEEVMFDSGYSVVYVKIDGKWLIDRVTEEEIEYRPSNYEHLQGLEWMIGSWVDASDDFVIEFECQWTANQNFISRKYSVSNAEGVESSGLQIIGWDPNEEQIRSWLFDSSGSYVMGTWTQNEDSWTVNSVATLVGGGSGSSTSVFTPLEDGNYAWKKINRVVDGQIMPNVGEVIIQRN